MPEPERDLFGLLVQDYDQFEHQFTGELVRARRPEVYRSVIALLGCGIPVRLIAQQLGVSDNTVRVVRALDANAVAQDQNAYGQRLKRMGAQAFAHAIEKLPDASARDAAVVGGIMDDHANLAMGQPTSISQTKGADHRPEQVAGWWSEPSIEVESHAQPVDSESTALIAQPPDAQQSTNSDAATDTSLVSAEQPLAERHQLPAPDPAPLETEGGGGGSLAAAAPGESMGSPAQ